VAAPRSWTAAALYTVAAALFVIPLVDVASQVWPLRPGLAEWRYGTIGLISNYFLTPVLGLILAGAAAVSSGHRRVQRALGGAGLAIAAVTVVLGLAFALDVVQLRRQVSAEALPMFRTGALKAAFKLVVYVVCYGLLGVAYWRGAAPPLEDAPPADVSWRLS
jgi:hypothetical protein